MRIAIVNDSLMAIESLRRIIVSSREHELAWIGHDGAEAVTHCKRDTPDIILMDLIMPVMTGVEATRRIMAECPCAILIVTATITGNTAKVFEAMGAGALDAVNTPVLGSTGDGDGRDTLLQKINTVGKLIKNSKRTQATPEPSAENTIATSGGHLIAIGASTGGPSALAQILAGLPADFPAAIAVIQHVDEQFAPGFAQWLNTKVALPVRLAEDGDKLYKGSVLVAGGDRHLRVTEDGTLRYSREPADYVYRPSVNVFFESLVQHWTEEAVGVLLTGMGKDGAAGLLAMRNRGCHTIAQDEASSAVYGMPKAACQLDAAAEILPLPEISQALTWYVCGNTDEEMEVEATS